MKTEIVKKLNKINHDFYASIAASFSNSRQFYWKGWLELVKHFSQLKQSKKQIRVLDLGCGNGRFGQFLFDKVSKRVFYIGLDNSNKLLNIAQEKLVKYNEKVVLENFDLIDNLLKKNLKTKLIEYQPDIITMFGVLHHIPGKSQRKKLIKELASLLPNDGLLIFTVWKFMDEDRLKNKIVDPQAVDLKKSNLEENDFILDWRRDIYAYRYCHLTNRAEVSDIVKNANLKIVDQISADGKSNNLNHYYICQKISS